MGNELHHDEKEIDHSTKADKAAGAEPTEKASTEAHDKPVEQVRTEELLDDRFQATDN